ncbi:MAG: UDP-glucose/GDP-mannose dehydrogenase family protein [Actinomycetota bacterium]|nr:UDP-glucose/GDP-mannose dehydrogenase family protein [Actinomycetota bacterium]
MADLGFDVVGLDVDEAKVAALAAGRLPFFEPGLPELLRKNLDTGRLRFTSSYDDLAGVDVHFVCVGTPQQEGGNAADLTHVDEAFRALLRVARPGALLVGKSTVPAGTAERLDEQVRAAGRDLELAWNPEFLREGFGIEDTLTPDRLVFGVRSAAAEQRLREVYAGVIAVPTPVVVTDFATAQLVKVAANAFLATKISFINAMAEVCEATGGDVTELSRALSYDPRIGGRFLQAGLGFGGGCLPKDIRGFMARADELGVDSAVRFLREVDAINLRRRSRTVEITREVLGGSFAGTRVAVLGAAFKPDSDDVRDSPALDVAAAVQRAGAEVVVYDPEALESARAKQPQLGYASSALDAARGADVVLHLTEWPEFRQLDPAVLSAVVARRQVVDGRNALDREVWRAAGWTYRALGRP